MLNWDELFKGVDELFKDVEPTAPTVPPPSIAPSKIVADIPDSHEDERKDAHRFDNRIRCIECGNLNDSGICRAASLGKIEASRTYTPIRDLLRRCDGFACGFHVIVTDSKVDVAWIVSGILLAFLKASEHAPKETIHAQNTRNTPLP